jgi:glycerol-3-phosphate dehydrogenase
LNPRAPLSRLAAKETVDLAHSYTPSAKARHECTTQDQPLFGGNITNMEEYIQEVANAARPFQLQDRQVRHLVHLYGTKAQELFPLLRTHPVLREQICRHQPDLKVELVYAIEQESAISLSDIFLRRTTIGWTRCHGRDCAATAAAFLGEYLGWTPARMEAELENFFLESEDACRRISSPLNPSVASKSAPDDREEESLASESESDAP